jgi:large subunit ribosomal protein L24
VRKSRQNPQGGRIQKEAAIHMSNVMPVDPKTDRPVRVRFAVKQDADGHTVKQRVTAGRHASGAVLSEVRSHARQSKGGKAS